jgi:hypothetical protein
MNKILLLLLCTILSGTLSGCILSRSIIYVNSQKDHLIEIHSASIDDNKLTVDYTVRRGRGDWAHAAVTRDVKTCSNYYIDRAEKPTETRYYTSQGDVIVSRPIPISEALPFINDKENKIVNDGGVMSSLCFNSSRQNIKPENRVASFMNQEPKSTNDLNKYLYYKEANPVMHYFYYVYKVEAQNEVHVVALQSPDKSYAPWYGPFLALLLPVAFVVDVVAFPIELMFYGEGTSLM